MWLWIIGIVVFSFTAGYSFKIIVDAKDILGYIEINDDEDTANHRLIFTKQLDEIDRRSKVVFEVYDIRKKNIDYNGTQQQNNL